MQVKLPFRRLYRQPNHEMYNHIDVGIIIQLVFKGVLVGLLAGFMGATFRYAIQYFEEQRLYWMSFVDPMSMVLWFIFVAVLGSFVYFLLRWAPLSGGSGIPQIEGEMMGLFNMNPYRIIVSKYVGGALNSLCGFSVGREGPSVQLGGAVGKMVAYWLKSPLREARILISAGSAAGLTAAFSAPISGAIFVFEEIHKSFYPMLVIPTFTAALVANFVTSIIFDLKPSLGFTVVEGIPLGYFSYLLLLGVFTGLVGVMYNKALLTYKTIYDSIKIPGGVKFVLTFIGVAIIGYDSQLLLGGGNHIISMVAADNFVESIAFLQSGWLSTLVGGYNEGQYIVIFLGLLLIGKILMTAFCFGCGIQGGIFLPMLVIGAATGAFFEKILVAIGWLPDTFIAQFVICAMGGILAASVRSPLLSILLVLEMTDSFQNIYAIGTVTIVGYLVAEILKEAPIYDTLLQRMMSRPATLGPLQTFFETKVSVVSQLIGKALKELSLPRGTMIISIERCGQNIVPMADTTLERGDKLYISCRKDSLDLAKRFFMEN